MNLKDKNIVITGGADGIGKALAKRFLNESPNSVHLIDINPNVIHVAELMGVKGYVVDVSNSDNLKSKIFYVHETDENLQKTAYRYNEKMDSELFELSKLLLLKKKLK